LIVGAHKFSTTAPSTAEIIPFARQNGAAPTLAAIPNDPLAGQTKKQVFVDCIWISDEDTNTKIMLLCIARFMDDELRGASMSYSQVAHDCGFSEPTAKRSGKKVRARWLTVERHGGRYHPGKGSENLYHGVIPPDLREELCRRVLEDEEFGVSQGHPESGVSDRHPEKPVSGYHTDTSGYHTDTVTTLSLNRAATPHLNDAGFIISADHGLVVPMQKVEEWRVRFPHIADLEAAISGLATTILSKGRMHPGWTCPEGWMVKPLAEINQEAADKKKVTAARIARANGPDAGNQDRRRGGNSRREIDEA